MTEKQEEKYWSEHSVCSKCGNIYENTNTDMVCPDCEKDYFNSQIDNDLKSSLIQNFKNFKGDFINKRSKYESSFAKILFLDEADDCLFDLESDNFRVEVKKQQNAQWLDIYKLINISYDDLYNISVVFFYYKKGENFINTVAVLTYKEILDIIDISENDFNLISQIESKKIQMKISVSKKDILNKSSFILT